MKLEYFGPVKATCLLPQGEGNKLVFIKVGAAFYDEQGRIVIKLEALPLPHQHWNGYLNIYEDDKE